MKVRTTLLPCQHGILASIGALKGLFEDLKKFKISYLLTRRLNQDPLESFFSVIRSLGRTNDNPTPTQFRYRMKTVLLGSKIKIPKGSNVNDGDDDQYIMSAKLFDLINYCKKTKEAKDLTTET